MVKHCQDDEVRMVLVGETGNGKSTTANAILGRQMDENNVHAYSECTDRFRTHITIVHTPGFMNSKDVEETCRTIQSEMGVNGMHIAIFYIVYQKMTEGDSIHLQMLMEKMNSTMHRKLFLVLTDCEDITDNPYTKSVLPVLRINSTLQDNREAECQIKTLIKKIQLIESQCKTYPVILVPRFHSTTIILIIVIVLLHSARSNDGDTNQVIHWKLMTKPVYFGFDVELVCIIQTEDTSEPMAWIRIPNGETIAYNKIPTDDTKYGIDVQYDDTKMVYNLTIKQFNSTDVNRAYRCDYGFHSYADKLLLNDKDFVSMPLNTDVEAKFTLAEETLIGNIQIKNCFPRPLCTGVLQGMNISEFMTIRYTNVSIFFNTNIEIKYSTHICGGSINVTCTFGDSYLHFNELVGDCSDKSNSTITVVLLIVGTLSLALGILVVLIKMRRRIPCYKLVLGSQMNAYDNRREIERLSVPHMVPAINDSGIGLSTIALNDNIVREQEKATEQKESSEMLLKD